MNLETAIFVFVFTVLGMAVCVWMLVRALSPKPPAPPVPKPPTVTKPETPDNESGPEVHAMLQRNAAGEWEHDGKWVREGTPAWQAAHDEPGRALRTPDGTIIEGVQ